MVFHQLSSLLRSWYSRHFTFKMTCHPSNGPQHWLDFSRPSFGLKLLTQKRIERVIGNAVGYWAEIRNSILLDCCSAPQSVSILPLFLNKILLRFFPKLIGVRRMLRRSAKLSGRWQQQKGFQKISACLTTLWNSYLITIWEGLVLVFSLLRFKCRKTSRYLVKFFLK